MKKRKISSEGKSPKKLLLMSALNFISSLLRVHVADKIKVYMS